MAMMVTLVNRTSKPLIGTWDGRKYVINPGKHEFPDYKAQKFRDQNPQMGSENVRTGDITYLFGIVEDGDDISPVEQNTDAIEKWDRKTLGGTKQVEVVAGDNGLYSRNNLSPGPDAGNGAVKSGFTKAD